MSAQEGSAASSHNTKPFYRVPLMQFLAPVVHLECSPICRCTTTHKKKQEKQNMGITFVYCLTDLEQTDKERLCLVSRKMLNFRTKLPKLCCCFQ